MNTSQSDWTVFHKHTAKNGTIEIDPNGKGLLQGLAFIEETLDRRHVNSSVAFQTTSFFEAVFQAIVLEVDNEKTKLEISITAKLGRTDIKILFPGKRFSIPEGNASCTPCLLLHSIPIAIAHLYRYSVAGKDAYVVQSELARRDAVVLARRSTSLAVVGMLSIIGEHVMSLPLACVTVWNP